MNKYSEWFKEYEDNNREFSYFAEIELLNEFKVFFRNYDEVLYKKMKLEENEKIMSIIVIMSLFDIEVQEWIKDNIIVKLNKENLFMTFMQILNNSLVDSSMAYIEIVMNSFVKTGLIKSIEFEDGIFYMTMPDNKVIRFTRTLSTKEEITEYAEKCHSFATEYIKVLDKKTGRSYALTILENDLFDYTRFHSFTMHNYIVYDFARNISIEYDDFKYLFKPDILLCYNASDLDQNVNILKESDQEFNECKSCDLLKLAMARHMNRENSKKLA